jgi:5-methylcytosine-specific restriction endonuclease McrA
MATSILSDVPLKYCRTCGLLLPADTDNFYKHPHTRDRLYVECKTCATARASRWNIENKERLRANQRRWVSKKPESLLRGYRMARLRRRARLHALDEHYTAAEWEALLRYVGHRCVACGCDGPLSADHIIPLFRGGPNTIDNIQPLCISCNSRKGVRIIYYLEERRHDNPEMPRELPDVRTGCSRGSAEAGRGDDPGSAPVGQIRCVSVGRC